jgi:hypothetical protein
MTHAATVERLRPAAMQSRPVVLPQVFEDPAAALRLVQERAPYVTMAAFHGMEDRLGGPRTQPFFRGAFDDQLFLENPGWIAAARESFGAGIVRPFKCLAQLNGPMTATGVHVDLPLYRGFGAAEAPVWLLMNMTYSGLFHDWMVPIASGLAWFYRGVGGAFAYWPDGIDARPRLERGPLWNRGVMSDNEYMFHGVAPIGAPEDRARLQGALRASDMLHFAGEDGWEIRDGERVAHRLRPEQVRVSLLWKAYVFKDERHLASFEDVSMNLTLDQVVDIYLHDLAGRGLPAKPPADPLADEAWKRLLESTYPQPLTPHAADDLA